MCHLKNKSEINLLAAETLFNNNLYPSCCHPAYYSCLQLMKYTIKEKIGISYYQQDVDVSKIDKRIARSGSHNYLIDKIVNAIKLSDKYEANKFKRNIEDLKAYREQADYEDCTVTRDMCVNSIDQAKKICAQLKSFF